MSELIIIKEAEIKFHISVLHTCIIKEILRQKYLMFVDREGHLNYLFFLDKLGFQPIMLCFVLLIKKVMQIYTAFIRLRKTRWPKNCVFMRVLEKWRECEDSTAWSRVIQPCSLKGNRYISSQMTGLKRRTYCSGRLPLLLIMFSIKA